MQYSIENRIFIVEEYIRTNSIALVRKKFKEKYPSSGVPAKSTIQDLVKKWRTTGNFSNAKRKKLLIVRTPDVVVNVENRISKSPNKSIQRLAEQVGVSRSSCRRILHGLQK